MTLGRRITKGGDWRIWWVYVGILIFSLVLMYANPSSAQNNQGVYVQGGIVNFATSGSTATMNISSTQDITKLQGNTQKTVINGAVINSATNGATSELNIASRRKGAGSGNQTVSVGGPVVSQASGMGVRNVVNIGGQ